MLITFHFRREISPISKTFQAIVTCFKIQGYIITRMPDKVIKNLYKENENGH
jgi:hypothetical protein